MEIKKFSEEAILDLREYALFYLFLSKSFHENLKDIVSFEREIDFSFVDLSSVMQFFEKLGNNSISFPYIVSNGYLYIYDSREELKSLEPLNRKIRNDLINQLLFKIREYDEKMKKNFNWEKFFSKFSFTSSIYNNFMEEYRESLVAEAKDSFDYIRGLLLEQHTSKDLFDCYFFNEDFLRFCIDLASFSPNLLIEPEFLEKINYILSINKHAYYDESNRNREHFYRLNDRVERQIRKIVK